MKMRIRTLGRWCAARLRPLSRPFRRIFRYWHRLDSKYTWRWRAANLFAAVVILAGIVIPIAQEVWRSGRYTLSAEALQLTGRTDPSLAKQLTYDESQGLYQFNKDAVATGGNATLPTAIQKASVGAADKSNTESYSLDIPEDFTKGVTYHDTNSQLSFKLVPQFKALPGKTNQGHLVFPLDNSSQAVYTLKNNGLKEDIIVPKVEEAQMRFEYTFELPKTLEVKTIPDGSGVIGIYSANPALFGDIQYGSDADKARVEEAREHGDKNTLVFGLPAPVVKDTDGKEAGIARFELHGNRLSVVAEGLKEGVGPLTIDPSVVVTSTSDFQSRGNDEGMINFTTSGQITRGGLTGATSGVWTATTSIGTLTGNPALAIEHAGSAIYNGYIYAVGGTNRVSGNQSFIRYAPLNSNGTVGAWQTTTVPPYVSSQTDVTVVTYSGYMYVLGGYDNNSSTVLSSVYYVAINSDGSLGSSWQTTTSLPGARVSGAAAASNGYMYYLGGTTTNAVGTNNQTGVYYASINANGTLSSWTSTTSLSYARGAHTTNIYNGYIYIFGGANATPTFVIDVQYAKVNSDGTLGSWMTTSNYTGSRYGHISTIYNGIAYLYGGWQGASTYPNTVQYAQVNANGSIGTWRTSSNNFTTGRAYPVGGAYNGYLYIGTGWDGTVNYNDMQYAAIDTVGRPTAFATLSNNFTTARALTCSVAYNGYLYALGGSTSDTGSQNVTTVQYTALNSSTGNNGSWSSTTVLPATIGSAECIAYNGYMYIGSGYTGSGSGSSNVQMYYVAINSNGTLGGTWTTSANSPPGSDRPGLFAYGTSSGTYMYSVQEGNGYNTWISSINSSTGAPGAWNDSGVNTINTYGHRGYAQVGKYLYAFGGLSSGTAYSAVEYTSINNNGSLNAWQSTTSLNTATGFTNGTTVNGCIYSVGGETGAGVSINSVQYACPNADGTISAWYNAPNLTVATTDLGVTSYNGYIYGVGGYTTSVQTTTQYAYVNNGGSGSNSTWTQAGNSLTGNTYNSGATMYNGYAYVVAGTTGSGAKNTVQYSALGADGSPGSFSNDAHTITGPRANLGTAAYNGYLYVLGGATDGASTRYGDVQYAPIGSSGALSGNFASTTSFVSGTGSDTVREGVCAVAYNGYMYAIGGYDGTSNHADIRYTAINSNGTLGTWANSGNNLGAVESHPNGCFVANGYLYMVGYDSVQTALVNSNGTLGTWKYTSRFNLDRDGATVTYSNGFVYLYGGCGPSCSSYYSDTQYAPVYAGGTLGAWQRSTSIFGSTTQSYASGLAVNGYLYMFGGETDGRNTVYYAPLSTISHTARYSKLVDLGNPVSVSSITYNGTLPSSSNMPGVAPISFRSAGSDGVLGSSTASSAITAGATACLATSQNYKRYLLVTITLDDTNAAIFADAAGTYSNVTDFTVNYITPHPPPNIRLRAGQTMQQGNLSPLDTCWPQ